MNTAISTEIIRRIAEKHGVSVEQVRDEMEESIVAAFENRANNDTWKQYFGDQVMPSPEEFIAVLASVIK